MEENRHIARKILAKRLDLLHNGAQSRVAQQFERLRKRKQQRARRAAKKYHDADGKGKGDAAST